jgi:hypothetical protein
MLLRRRWDFSGFSDRPGTHLVAVAASIESGPRVETVPGNSERIGPGCDCGSGNRICGARSFALSGAAWRAAVPRSRVTLQDPNRRHKLAAAKQAFSALRGAEGPASSRKLTMMYLLPVETAAYPRR